MENKNKEFYIGFPNLKQCSIQTFDDKGKNSELASIMSFNEDDIKQKMISLNSKGAGIYFSVNQMKEGERKKEFVIGINTWIVESDELDKTTQLELMDKAPIKPSAVIESNKSYHIYYFAENGTKENWVKINMGLCEYYKGDVKVAKDISRVLRLPGFYHNKGEPFMVSCINFNGIKHKEEDMLKAFPYEEKQVEIIKKEISQIQGLDFWEFIASFDNEMMLRRLSRTPLVNGEDIEIKKIGSTKKIICNGEINHCWIDEKGMIGAEGVGGPTWIQWIEYYGNYTKGDISKWAKENCRDIIPAKYYEPLDLKKKQEIEVKKQVKTIEPRKNDIYGRFMEKQEINKLTWGVKDLDNIFDKPRKSDFIYLVGKAGTGKTTFSTFMAIQNAKKGIKVLYISLEMALDSFENFFIEKSLNITQRQREEANWTEYQKMKIKQFHDELRLIDIIDMRDIKDISTELVIELSSNYDMIYLDNFGFLTKTDKEAVEQIMTSRKILNFINDNQKCFVMVHHMAKGQNGTETAEGRGSQKLVDDSFKWITIDKAIGEDKTNFIMAKNRTGKTGKLPIIFNEGIFEKDIALEKEKETSKHANNLFNNF